jgi:hypothetical protein
MSDLYNLKSKARLEIYEYIDKNIRKLPRKEDGTFDEISGGFHDNDVDALRHAYVSGAYTMEFSEGLAENLGRLHELVFTDTSSSSHPRSQNMDLWNNAVGRKYGKKAKTRAELLKLLHDALNRKELIISPDDERDYKGSKFLKKKPKSLVLVVEQSESGENLTFYDVDKKIVLSKEEFVVQINQGFYPDYSVKTIHGKETPVSKRDRFKFNNLG